MLPDEVADREMAEPGEDLNERSGVLALNICSPRVSPKTVNTRCEDPEVEAVAEGHGDPVAMPEVFPADWCLAVDGSRTTAREFTSEGRGQTALPCR